MTHGGEKRALRQIGGFRGFFRRSQLSLRFAPLRDVVKAPYSSDAPAHEKLGLGMPFEYPVVTEFHNIVANGRTAGELLPHAAQEVLRVLYLGNYAIQHPSAVSRSKNFPRHSPHFP